MTAAPESSAVLVIHAHDVDEPDEQDVVYFIETDSTEHELGLLSGQSAQWSTTIFVLDKEWVKAGTNSIRIEVDSGWALTVDSAQLVIDGGPAESASITDLTIDSYDNSTADVSLDSTVTTLIGTAGSYSIETNLIDPDYNNLDLYTYSFTTSTDDETVARTSNFTYPKSSVTGTYTINAFLFDSSDVVQSVSQITFEHEQDVGVTSIGQTQQFTVENGEVVSSPTISVNETPIQVYVPVRTAPLTCWQVWVNEDNNFEFIFWWLYGSNNWVRIYDMDENLVFEKDLAYGEPTLEVDLPDGMYTVRSYHTSEEPIQEFIIGKP